MATSLQEYALSLFWHHFVFPTLKMARNPGGVLHRTLVGLSRNPGGVITEPWWGYLLFFVRSFPLAQLHGTLVGWIHSVLSSSRGSGIARNPGGVLITPFPPLHVFF
jgi:hypothetical protein